MKRTPQKTKLLFLLDVLRTETDEEHPISRIDLCRRLNENGIPSNPRTLSLDIEAINNVGYEIMSKKSGRQRYYYVEDRRFSLPELKILIDAVEAANFISEKKTDLLIEKIAELGGLHRAELLKGSRIMFNTRKHNNETVLYTIDRLEDAIVRGKAIEFNYFDLDENAKKTFRVDEEGETKKYTVDPVALIYNEDNYYLVAYNKKHPGTTANYRIDRIDRVEICENTNVAAETVMFRNDLNAYTERVFKMYNGEEIRARLEFDKSLLGPVFDKFGEDLRIYRIGENRYAADVTIAKSPVLFGWLFQFGDRIKIVSPKALADEYDNAKK